jgi:hypothetical protein
MIIMINKRMYDASGFASEEEAKRFAEFWGAEVFPSEEDYWNMISRKTIKQ